MGTTRPAACIVKALRTLAFEAEEREDRRKEAQRRRDGLPVPKRDLRTLEAFADTGAAPRAELGLSDY